MSDTTSVSQAGGPDTTRSTKGSATSATAASTTSAKRIELCTTRTRRSAGPSAPRPHATVAEAPRSRRARATSAPGRSSTREAATRRSQSPTPYAGSSRAMPSSGRASSRIGAPLARRRTAHTTVPFVRELPQARPIHPPRVTRMQAHPRFDARVTPGCRRQQRTGGVLAPGGECGNTRTRSAVVLPPVAVPAAPHLVDAPLGDAGAELRLVVDDGELREVMRFPAGPPQPRLQVDLLGIEKEILVEQADLVERLTAQDERGTHHPVHGTDARTLRLLDPELSERCETHRADEWCRKAPRRILQASVGIDQSRAEGGDLRVRVQILGDPLEAPVVCSRVFVQDVDVPSGRRPDDRVVVRGEAGPVLLLDHPHVREALAHGGGGAVLRRVVEHDDLGLRAGERLETRQQEPAAVGVDD